MISHSTRTRRGTPKFFRALLTFYIVRHIVGVVLFLWLLQMAWRGGPPFSWIMLVLTFAYAGYAVVGTRKIHNQYRASVRRRDEEEI